MELSGGAMAGYASMKVKRKDLDEVNDDFSDSSLFSPARKSRRLDAGLRPILEAGEPETSLSSEESNRDASIMEEFPNIPANDERAVVLFQPIDTHSLNSPPDFSFSIDPDIISSFRNFWPGRNLRPPKVEDEKPTMEKQNLAIIPWIPSQAEPVELPEVQEPEPMEAEEADAANTINIEHRSIHGTSSRLPQLQQQHCIAPNPPWNMLSPINW